MKKKFGYIFIFLILILFSLYFIFFSKVTVTKNNYESETKEQLTVRQSGIPSDWLEYNNLTYNLSIFYPNNLSVLERFGYGGTLTVIFQDIKTKQGFQIFISSYNDAVISDSRIAQDAPTANLTTKKLLNVNGKEGLTFVSSNVNLGDLREAWFVHSSHLYEFTSLTSLDSWFSSILKTVSFR